MLWPLSVWLPLYCEIDGYCTIIMGDIEYCSQGPGPTRPISQRARYFARKGQKLYTHSSGVSSAERRQLANGREFAGIRYALHAAWREMRISPERVIISRRPPLPQARHECEWSFARWLDCHVVYPGPIARLWERLLSSPPLERMSDGVSCSREHRGSGRPREFCIIHGMASSLVLSITNAWNA